jgi:XTP/dITP diphosphohydrolase
VSQPARIVVLASRNRDKVRELRELFAGLPFDVRTTEDWPGLPEVIEDGTTILGNASRKAILTAAYTGEIAVADDTSLRVEALQGLPDVFAARFAGPGATYGDNCDLLVDLMRDVPDGFREAAFRTAAVWVDPRPRPGLAGGATPGAHHRWLHGPWRRSIHLDDPVREAAHWNGLIDRRAVWEHYVALLGTPTTIPGVDRARLAGLVESLTRSSRHGGRPDDADPTAARLPDPRIWTAAGPDDPHEPTRIAPTGLPSQAPGRAVAAPVWFELATEGVLLGDVLRKPAGGRGFGYDPVFRPAGSSRSLAQYAPAEKNALSHRGRAMRRLLDAVRSVYGTGA